MVAGSKFILGGGSGFTAFTEGTALSNLGITDVDSTINYLTDNPGVTPRAGQSAVSVIASGDLLAGQEIALDVASLSYTQGDTASEVTVSLGAASVTAPITGLTGSKDLNDAGQASVTFTVPADLSGTQDLYISTNAGTDITLSVNVEPAAETPHDSSFSSSDHRPLLKATFILSLLASIGSVLAVLFPQQLAAILG